MKLLQVNFVVVFSILLVGLSGAAQENRTYTKDADFDEGRLEGVNHDAPNSNQLQISFEKPPFIDPYIWVANYAQETVTKVDTRTGGQVGKYHSVLMLNWDGSKPDVPVIGSGCNSPSRTTVDGDGNSFVANRGLCNGTNAYSRASLTKIAGVLGHCVDRNGNGRIDTSRDVNGDGVINEKDSAEFFGQSDECLLWTKNYTKREDRDLGRSVAVDADQNLWLGGYDTSKLFKLDGKTGAELDFINPSAETGTSANIYGLAVGPGGFIYTSDINARRLMKIDPAAPAGRRVVATVMSPVPTYGIAVDRKGIVWLGNWSEANRGGVVRVDFVKGTAELMSIPSSSDCNGHTRGVAVDHEGDVWVACWSTSKLLRFNSAGVFVRSYPTAPGTLGVAIDHKQRIWTANQTSDTLSRIDPGGLVPTESYPAGGHPYSYWDMTGFQLLSSTMRQGEWTVEHDSGKPGTRWGTIHWNRELEGATPAGTNIVVFARAADDKVALESQPLVEVTRATSFTKAGVTGRYLQVNALLRTKTSGTSPVLSDLTVIPSFSWSTPSEIGGETLMHRAVLLKNGQVFIVGGFTEVARLFNPATATWRTTASASASRRYHTATLLADGRVLVAGGASEKLDATAELYDPTSETWAPASSMGQARIRHTATLLGNGRILVVGGTAPGLSASAELYDPVANTWVSTGRLSQGRHGHTATVLKSGHVLVVGGIDDSGTPLASAEVYDPVAGTWSTTAPMKQTRYEHTATLLADNRVIVAGNKFSADSASTTELYDPATKTWSTGANMIHRRARHQATLLQTGQVLITGGYHDFEGLHKSAEIYDPVTGTWAATGSMTMSRESHTLTLLNNGEVLATGGISWSPGGQRTSELFSP
ncbi:hypothetical protein NR798_03750 [Archangium gephyra]|uniref:kelch repeat-containing protein n=1 Tax=Archangium gephyra TaxID=48 RepID=UPI0035D4EDC8